MPKPSTIDILPPEVKAQLQAWLQDPRITQLEATERANSLLALAGHPERVTKSAVNRYAVKMDEVGAKMRQSREVAEMMIGKLGAAPQGKTGLLINEMLRAMAFDLTLKIQDADIADPETLAATIDQVKSLALAAQRLEQAASINVKRETEIKKNALEDAARTMETTAKNEGVSAETIQRIRRDVLMMAG
jgi:hypothetical protein